MPEQPKDTVQQLPNCDCPGCAKAERCWQDCSLTMEEAKAAGLMMNGYTTYIPGIPCITCGRFVGRDGHLSIEHFEMSSEIASVDGECARCMAKEAAA